MKATFISLIHNTPVVFLIISVAMIMVIGSCGYSTAAEGKHERFAHGSAVPFISANHKDSHEMQSGGTNQTGPDEGMNFGRDVCDLERKMLNAGLVNIKAIDGSILVDLKYASAQNFMGANVYGDLKDCYLRPEAALKLKKANDLLKARNPRLRILVADGCRPRSVQRRMYAIVKGTPMQRYVANPAVGSMHNFGAAVDVTISDEDGNRLDMGVPMDYFGILSHPCEEERFLREGKLTEKQVAARRLLREVMTRSGFQPLSIEWWHFNSCDRKIAVVRYGIVE